MAGTEHEDYPIVPLVCDPHREKETCLISEMELFFPKDRIGVDIRYIK